MLYKIVRFLISRHAQTIILFGMVVGFVSTMNPSPIRTRDCPNFSGLIFSPSGDLLAGFNGGSSFSVYETETMLQLASFEYPGVFRLQPRVFSKNSEYVAVIGEALKPDGSLSYFTYIWKIRTQRKPIIIQSDGGYYTCAFSPDSTSVVVANDGRHRPSGTNYTLSIWNTETGERIREITSGHQDTITSVNWAVKGSQIVTSSSDGTVRIMDAGSGVEVKCLQSPNDKLQYFQGAFSANGEMVTAMAGNEVISWVASSGQRLKSYFDLKGHIISFHPYSAYQDLIVRRDYSEWIDDIDRRFSKWLPDSAKKWLQKRRTRHAVYDYQAKTNSFHRIMELPSSAEPVNVIQDAQEIMAIDRTTDGNQKLQLVWYSLDQSAAWRRAFGWATGISLAYWLLLSFIVWRKRTRKVQLSQPGKVDLEPLTPNPFPQGGEGSQTPTP